MHVDRRPPGHETGRLDRGTALDDAIACDPFGVPKSPTTCRPYLTIRVRDDDALRVMPRRAAPVANRASPPSQGQITSVIGQIGNFGQANYAASKAGAGRRGTAGAGWCLAGSYRRTSRAG
jgi:hypothetical protein